MKQLLTGLAFSACFSVSACAPSTILIPDGNGFIELTQTRHMWESNAVSVGHCDHAEYSKCPAGTPKQVYVMTGPGPGMAGAGIQAMGMVGGAALVRDGLIKSKAPVNNSNTTNENFSTKFVAPK